MARIGLLSEAWDAKLFAHPFAWCTGKPSKTAGAVKRTAPASGVASTPKEPGPR